MDILDTALEGVYIINNFNRSDIRGSFTKTYNKLTLNEIGIDFEIRESYYSISRENVIRGMHFQLPPHDHEKLVYVPNGKIIDVVIDLRKKSKTYKQCISVELSSDNNKSIFIPKGLAHGFKSLESNTITVYNVATEYNPDSDSGVRFDSFGYDWKTEKVYMSDRDKKLLTLAEFEAINPF